MKQLRVSIIIPTKNRPNDLACCLNSINDVADKFFELVVVDSSNVSHIIETNRSNTLKANGKYLFFAESGVSKARNYGIQNSSGEILVFADDDFVVTNGWLTNLLKPFEDPKIFCVTGRMLALRKDASSNLYERTMSFDRGHSSKIFSKKNLQIRGLFSTLSKLGQKRLGEQTPVPWAVGYGFCSFQRSVFDLIGFYDINLGRGTKAIGSEDPDIFYRILKADLSIYYSSEAVILHNHRVGKDRLYVDFFNSGKSISAFVSKYFKNDLYVKCISFGYFSLLIFSGIKAAIFADKDLKMAINIELKGYLSNWI
ncbi:MAG: glycosyltransferase [Nitrososphaerota archaeon]|jgi:glycosyltransferase involved in cell wall biosynthesis|nr:glycosyltransferase [Nitrososphaerota archaeon]